MSSPLICVRTAPLSPDQITRTKTGALPVYVEYHANGQCITRIRRVTGDVNVSIRAPTGPRLPPWLADRGIPVSRSLSLSLSLIVSPTCTSASLPRLQALAAAVRAQVGDKVRISVYAQSVSVASNRSNVLKEFLQGFGF